MIVQGKRNIDDISKKKSRFESLQNFKDSKFSAYKYERNMLMGKINYNNPTDEYDYVNDNEIKQQYDRNEQQQLMIKVNRRQQQQSSGVDNLCQLWDKLGQQQQQNSSSEIAYHNHNKNQLTEEELMECFGEEQEEGQNAGENNTSNKVIVNVLVGNCRVDKCENRQQQQEGHQEPDQDLMDIWGQDQHTQQATEAHNSEQQQQVNYKRKDKLKQEQQHYDWIDRGAQTTNKKNTSMRDKKNKIQEQNDDHDDHDDDEQMELEDPNIIVFQSKKSQIQKNTSQNQLKPINSDKPKSSTLSIINEIHLENNSRGMIKLIPNRHYQIFDAKAFSLNPFKPKTYSYFGVQAKNFSLLQPSPIFNTKDNIFYLYEFETQQALLEMKPQPVDKSYEQFLSVKKLVSIGPNEKATRRVVEYSTDFCYKVRVCATKQHIATLFYKVIKDGYLYSLRLYDEYENTHSEPIALIQVKDGYVNECCYCNTNVFFQKDYIMNPYYAFIGKKSSSRIQKLRMILNLKDGKLTANMGIGGIQSSPFNCCLENQLSQKFIYLMGLMYEDGVSDYKEQRVYEKWSYQLAKRSNNFIIKVGEGVTPLLGLTITAGRKMYVDSFQ